MKILRYLNPFRAQSRKANAPLLSKDEFKAIIWHECARCDRNNHQFSIVLVDIEKNISSRSLNNLILRIIKRMRTTDVLGWFDDQRIGIFLPETDRQGAVIFLTDFTDDGENYRIFNYPSSLPFEIEMNRSDNNDPDSDEPRGGGSGGRKEGPSPDHDAVDCSFGSEIKTFINHRNSTESLKELITEKAIPRWKRSIDIFGSVVGLVALFPIFVIAATYIKIVSPGPVFFKQERVGYMGKIFTMWKFRTMRIDANPKVHINHLENLIKSDTVMTKLDTGKDRRLIPLAGLFRKTSIDEIPQLINVLRGEMSLVGPRPCIAYEAKNYNLWHNRRFHVLPGMTGLWQVSGKNRTTFTEMMRFDISYSQSNSLISDIIIFTKTFPVVAREALSAVWGKLGKEQKTALNKKANVSQTLSNFIRQMFL